LSSRLASAGEVVPRPAACGGTLARTRPAFGGTLARTRPAFGGTLARTRPIRATAPACLPGARSGMCAKGAGTGHARHRRRPAPRRRLSHVRAALTLPGLAGRLRAAQDADGRRLRPYREG